jgi:nitrogen fixation protein FixH
MGALALCVVLGLIPLAGIAYILLAGDVISVDGLFMSLILLAISGIFFLNALLELKSRRAPKAAEAKTGKAKAAAAAAGVRTAAPVISTAPAQGEVRKETGVVVEVTYFEAPVGQSNKSFVTFQPNGAGSAHVIVLGGDLRNALPIGKRVTITYAASEEGNRLIAAE